MHLKEKGKCMTKITSNNSEQLVYAHDNNQTIIIRYKWIFGILA